VIPSEALVAINLKGKKRHLEYFGLFRAFFWQTSGGDICNIVHSETGKADTRPFNKNL
jgi:hypothetical protein